MKRLPATIDDLHVGRKEDKFLFESRGRSLPEKSSPKWCYKKNYFKEFSKMVLKDENFFRLLLTISLLHLDLV